MTHYAAEPGLGEISNAALDTSLYCLVDTLDKLAEYYGSYRDSGYTPLELQSMLEAIMPSSDVRVFYSAAIGAGFGTVNQLADAIRHTCLPFEVSYLYDAMRNPAGLDARLEEAILGRELDEYITAEARTDLVFALESLRQVEIEVNSLIGGAKMTGQSVFGYAHRQ